MKLTVLFILISVGCVLAGKTYSQTKTLTLHMENSTVKEVLAEIESQSEFRIMYSGKFVDVDREVSLDVKNQKIESVLNTLFAGTDVGHTVKDRFIVLITPELIYEGTLAVIQQQRSVSGTVTDESGLPLPGVTVLIKGTTQGTVTNANGNYSITNIPEDATLVFSFVGMRTQEVQVGNQSQINVTMQMDAIGIEEVVAIGYGSQKKSDLTGSVSTVNIESMTKRQVGQTSMALQGIASGVTITQNSGQPGKDNGTIRIRGIGTLGDSNPLILVDGVASDINSVDPNDIESISVLKDAASAAIYGSRAANGVILITTKRANQKAIVVSYGGYVGVQSPTDMPELVSGLDHMLLLNESKRNAGQSEPFSEEYLAAYRANSPSDLYPETDWQDLTMTGNGLMQGHSVNISGGNEIVMTRASFSMLKQNALIPNTGFDRNSIRINTDIKASDKLKFGIDIAGNKQYTYEPGAMVDEIFFAIKGSVPQNMIGVLSDGRYGEGWIGTNPFAYANASGKRAKESYDAIINLRGDWSPIKNMDVSVIWTPKIYQTREKNFRRSIQTYYGNGTPAYNPVTSSLNQSSYQTTEQNIKALVSYKWTLNEHNFTALGGFEQIENENDYFGANRDNFQFEDYQVMNAGDPDTQRSTGSGSAWGLQSYFGRVNYNYKQRYLIQTNIRYDGSSRFAEGNKWGVFPSLSLGWRISEENFMNNIEAIDNLKLRASWGLLGNQNIGNYPFASTVNLQQYYAFNDKLVTGGSVLDMSNTLISWEETEMVNVGIDLALFNKFSLIGEYYIKKTSDILLTLPVAYTIGLNPPYQNAGSVKNTGWELQLSYSDNVGDFSYGISGFLSDVKNEITDLKDTGPYINDYLIREVGQPIDSYYGYDCEGIFQTQAEVDAHATQFGVVAPGDLKYKDISGPDGVPDGKISADYDRVIFGSSIPRYTFSLNLNAEYKGFDMSIFLQGVGKAKGYLSGMGIFPFQGSSTTTTDWLDRWTPDNNSTTKPRLNFNGVNNYNHSSYWMQDASYIRMKNAQIGYTLTKSVLKKTFIDYCRIYLAGENLFTLDNFQAGYDVETPANGMMSYGMDINRNAKHYPVVKIYSVGLNVNF